MSQNLPALPARQISTIGAAIAALGLLIVIILRRRG